jgi:hypothetical protein
MVNKLIGALIVVVLGLALLPLVADTVATLTQAPEVGPPEVVAGVFYDTTVGTLIQAIPILYVIMIVVGVTGYFYLTRK